MRKNVRKGISPIIATVLLIAITIAAGLAIYGWVSGLIGAGTSSTRLPGTSTLSLTLLSVTSNTATIEISNPGTYTVTVSNAAVTVDLSNGNEASSVSISPSSVTVPPGSFATITLSGLSSGTTYVVSVTGTDSQGTVSSNVLTFNTLG
ncbi:hypothetical protein PQ610_00540 [Tardisphaera miroshnichenkoae]